MEFDKVISERFSVRKFKDEAIKKEDIEQILKAGHLAPTGCNIQPQRILVINSPSSLSKLKECTKCHFDAPCAFLVCFNRDESWKRPYDSALSAPIDATIVATHMVLKAQDIGVGSCFVMHFNPFKMREAFNIPENIEPQLLIVMGYPADDAEPIKMHSTFRDINETVFYESF